MQLTKPVLLLAALATAVPLAACIFDHESYQGGGRIAHGATANPSQTSTDDTSFEDQTAFEDTTATEDEQEDAGNELLDADTE